MQIGDTSRQTTEQRFILCVARLWSTFPVVHNAILVVMPNNLHCSFCHQSEDQTGPLLAKMDAGPKRHPVRICKSCAEMAIDTIDREVLRRAGEQPRLRVI